MSEEGKTAPVTTIVPRRIRRQFNACVRRLSLFFGMDMKELSVSDAIDEIVACDPGVPEHYAVFRNDSDTLGAVAACKSTFTIPQTDEQVSFYSFLTFIDSRLHGTGYETFAWMSPDKPEYKHIGEMKQTFEWMLYTMFCYMEFPHRRDFRHFMWEDEFINMKFRVGSDIPEYAKAVAQTSKWNVRKQGGIKRLQALSIRSQVAKMQNIMTKYMPNASSYMNGNPVVFMDAMGAGAFPKMKEPDLKNDVLTGKLDVDDWDKIICCMSILSKVWSPRHDVDSPWATRAMEEYSRLISAGYDPRTATKEAARRSGIGECVTAILDGVPADDVLA